MFASVVTGFSLMLAMSDDERAYDNAKTKHQCTRSALRYFAVFRITTSMDCVRLVERATVGVRGVQGMERLASLSLHQRSTSRVGSMIILDPDYTASAPLLLTRKITRQYYK